VENQEFILDILSRKEVVGFIGFMAVVIFLTQDKYK
jgi:hypothetical protein